MSDARNDAHAAQRASVDQHHAVRMDQRLACLKDATADRDRIPHGLDHEITIVFTDYDMRRVGLSSAQRGEHVIGQHDRDSGTNGVCRCVHVNDCNRARRAERTLIDQGGLTR